MFDAQKFAEFVYRFRWPSSVLALALVVAAFMGGISQIATFSAQVDSLKESPAAESQPRLFDARTDIWFDPQDDGLKAYRDIEEQFIAEDSVIIAFEEKEHPWGVFSEKALRAVRRITEQAQQVPYVRSVRSLTESPWIRWGEVEPGESGLIVNDFFENPPETYTEEQRLQRMIAVMGAARAAELVGEAKVREVIGNASFDDYIGEPRFLNSIVSADGRTTAIQVQVLRQKLPEERLDAAFGPGDSSARQVGPVLHTIEAQTEAVHDLKRIVADETDYQLHIAGIPVLEQHFPEVGLQDMAFVGLMFLVIALVLLVVYRRLSGVSLPLLVVFGSILGMNGLVWYFGDLINNLTSVAPVVMTAVGVADAVHLVTAYFLLRPKFSVRRELIIEVLRRNALPVLLTSVTTAVAFFSLMTSAIEPIQMLGYTAGIGTIIAYVLSMTLVPAALSLLPLKAVAEAGPDESSDSVDDSSKPHWTDPIASLLERRRTLVLALTGAVVVLAAIGMTRVQVESDMRLMFPEDDPVTSDLMWIEDHMGGSGDLDIVFYGPALGSDSSQASQRQAAIEELQVQALETPLSPEQDVRLSQLQKTEADYQRRRIANSAEFLQQVDAFERRLTEEGKQPGSLLAAITSFDSPLSVLRKMHQVQNENRAAFYRVPQAQDIPAEAAKAIVSYDDITEERLFVPAQTAATMSAQYYLQYENGAKPPQNLSSLLTQDRRGFRIAARVSSMPSEELLQMYQRIREIAQQEFPQLIGSERDIESGAALSSMRLSGKHYLFTNMLQRFSDTLIASMSLALLAITLLIMIVFRSVKVGLVSMVPNVLPLVVPLAMFGWLNLPIDGPAVIVATIALGVCVDDTIHFLTKFTHARKSGKDANQAVRYAFRQVGAALTWTSVVLVLGFAVLSMSTFRPNMLIGVLGAIMVALAWVADLLVTPALLAWIDRKREQPLSQVELSAQPAE